MNESLPIFTVADWNYRGPLSVTLVSLDRNGGVPRGQPVFVLTTRQDAARYQAQPGPALQNLVVRYVSIETDAFAAMPISPDFGPMTYARLLLDRKELCPFDRILYLDSDLLIRGSIAELFTAVRTMRAAIAGVRDGGIPTVSQRSGVFNWRELGLDPHQPYLNAGVLGLRLDLIRERRYFQRACEHLLQYGARVVLCDQEAINAVIGPDNELWSERFNFATSYLNRSERRRMESVLGRKCCSANEATIAHFSGNSASKPWHVNTLSPFRVEYEVWMKLHPEIEFPPTNTRLEARFGVFLAGCIRRVAAAV